MADGRGGREVEPLLNGNRDREQEHNDLDVVNLEAAQVPPANGISWKFRALEAALLAGTSAIYAVTLLVNGFATFAYHDPQIFGFKYLTGNVSDSFPTDITPDNWVFWIWALIYLWQAVWLGWAWTYPFRPQGVRTISIWLYIPFSVSCACNITWVYLWGNEILVGSLAVIIFFALSLIVSVAFAAHKTASIPDNELVSRKDEVSKWVTYVLVHNGLALYMTWLCIAWLLNMSVVADEVNGFKGALNRTNAGTVALSILSFEIILWFLLEQTVFERYVRYIHTVYPVIIVALASVVAKHWNDNTEESRNHIFALGILVLVGILQMARFAFIIIFYFMRKHRAQADG